MVRQEKERRYRILLASGRPYMTLREVAEFLGVSARTASDRAAEMERSFSDRYGHYAVIRDGNIVLLNVLAFIDYESFRQRLQNATTARYVPDYDPVEVRRAMGFHFLDDGLVQKMYTA